MEITLNEVAQRTNRKILKVLLLNLVIWVATFTGYHFMSELLASDNKGAGKLAAIIFMGPVLALFASINIGTKEQKSVEMSSKGVRFGGHMSGFSSFEWQHIRVTDNKSRVITIDAPTQASPIHLALNHYGINDSQWAWVQQLAK